ncbi:unnamed protein product, partial [Trichobilharzia regenti]
STDDGKLWPVPISLTCSTKNGKYSLVFKHILKSASEEVDIPLNWPIKTISLDDCVIRANADATGFYHTRYDAKQMNTLIDDMKLGQWTTSSRFMFINDGFALVSLCFVVFCLEIQMILRRQCTFFFQK